MQELILYLENETASIGNPFFIGKIICRTVRREETKEILDTVSMGFIYQLTNELEITINKINLQLSKSVLFSIALKSELCFQGMSTIRCLAIFIYTYTKIRDTCKNKQSGPFL